MQKDAFKKQILEMEKIDQKTRMNTKLDADILSPLVYAIDGIHNYRIHKIIETVGYPTEKMVGKRALHAFWLLVQHQDYDVALQEQCLSKCGFYGKDEAYLTDRVKVNKGEKQIFGTQFYVDGKGKFGPRPTLDRKNLNKRRRRCGLEPFEKYERKFRAFREKQKKKKNKRELS